jgi:transcription elongation factor Elf1
MLVDTLTTCMSLYRNGRPRNEVPLEKTCPKCGFTKAADCFAKRSRNHATLHSYCKECMYKADKERREANPEKARERTAKYVKKRQEFIDNYKAENGCSECGYKKNLAALHFHHLDSAMKELQISSSQGLPRIKKEMEKCIILCANCHAEITWPDKNTDHVHVAI